MPIPADWHSIRSDALNIPPATKPEDFGFGGYSYLRTEHTVR